LFLAKYTLTASAENKKKNLNFIVLGLFKKQFLDDLIKLEADLLNLGDRLIPLIAALSKGVVYLDEELWTKTRRADAEKVIRQRHLQRSHNQHNMTPLPRLICKYLVLIKNCDYISYSGKLYGFYLVVLFGFHTLVWQKAKAKIKALAVKSLRLL
jgi:uncharacterized membrane protein